MTLRLLVVFWCGVALFTVNADEPADRVAITRFITGLNAPDNWRNADTLAHLFTTDADRPELLKLLETHQKLLALERRPMSEVSTPRIEVRSIRFVASDVAIVVAGDTLIGSQYPSVSRLFFVLKRYLADWRIAAFTVETTCF